MERALRGEEVLPVFPFQPPSQPTLLRAPRGLQLTLGCSGLFHLNTRRVYPRLDSSHLNVLASSPAQGTEKVAGKHAVMTD